MAFLSKVGNILKQTVSKQVFSDSSALSPLIYQPIRCMSSSKVFVGGLSYGTDDTSLQEAFSQYGQVVEARVIMDRESGRSRGFGFVTYTSSEEASSAIQALDGQELHGRRVRVNYATDRARGPGFGGGFGGGGYGGGGYGGGGGGYGGGGGNYGGGGYGASGGGYGGSYGGTDGQASSDDVGGYGSRAANYGGGNPGNYNAGGGGSYGGGTSFGSSGDYGVGGGGGGSAGGSSFGSGGEFSISGGAGTTNTAGDGRFGEGSGLGYSGGDQPDSYANSRMGNGAEDYEPNEPLEDDYKDDDDGPNDYAKRP